MRILNFIRKNLDLKEIFEFISIIKLLSSAWTNTGFITIPSADAIFRGDYGLFNEIGRGIQPHILFPSHYLSSLIIYSALMFQSILILYKSFYLNKNAFSKLSIWKYFNNCWEIIHNIFSILHHFYFHDIYV